MNLPEIRRVEALEKLADAASRFVSLLERVERLLMDKMKEEEKRRAAGARR